MLTYYKVISPKKSEQVLQGPLADEQQANVTQRINIEQELDV